MRRILFIFLATCLSFGANAASFDCDEAKTLIENAICENPALSSLDDELGIIFKQVKQKVGDSSEFKTIARGNLALRERCKSESCIEKWLRNSIELYNYLFAYLPADEMAQYPENVKEACSGDPAVTIEMVECANAKTEFHEKQSQGTLNEILAMKVSDKRKQLAKELLARGKKDADYYCGIAADVPGTISRIIGADCYLTWAKKIQDLIETQKQTWEDELEMEPTTSDGTSEPPSF
ncbi:MAG: hypothetical protein LUC43_01150 [Burkholderiales bacterium]|nr:hypothetical protein [Burkholderiales bacterium]